MKRYRVLSLDFDTRATMLAQEIGEEWEPAVKEQWKRNKERIKEGIVAEYGPANYHAKIERFVELGASPRYLST